MQEVVLPPSTDLMQSLGAVGYDLRTALADIVDNSISAGARDIRIAFEGGRAPFIAVTDDGCGMGAETLRVAMQLAGNGPSSRREDTDLGRFGLGLKTASFSQCRCLSVYSRGSDGLIGAQWDLERIARTRSWSLSQLDEQDVIEHLGEELEVPTPQGTTVVWTELESFRATWGESDSAMDAAMDRAVEWLSLVFHRFLNGDRVERVSMSVNGAPLVGKDPFLRGNRATSIQPVQRFPGARSPVVVAPVTLPQQDKLTSRERERLHLRGERLIDTQGFYVYRANRLLSRGKWFGLQRPTDTTKLARVSVDVGNDMDAQWALDIKKSTARPPRALLDQLRAFVERMCVPSRRTQTFRGRRVEEPGRVWQYVADRQGAFRYEINRDHPVVRALVEETDPEVSRKVLGLLGVVERTFPIHDAALRVNGDEKVDSSGPDNAELCELASSLRRVFLEIGAKNDEMLQMLRACEPFDRMDVTSVENLLGVSGRRE